MTSPLRRKLPITVSRTTARAAAISFAALLGSFATATAQSPVQPPVTPPIYSPIAMPVAQAPAAKPAEPAPMQQSGVGSAVKDVNIKLDLPKREDVFRFESNVQLGTRIKRELQTQYNIPVDLPTIPVIAAGPLPVRANSPMQVLIEPSYVMHRRLFFEHKNTERAGWDFGPAQPILSTLHFYKDVVLLPSKMASNLFEPYETSAGKCLPGSPTPLLWYPPEITTFGGVVGAAAIVGTVALFP